MEFNCPTTSRQLQLGTEEKQQKLSLKVFVILCNFYCGLRSNISSYFNLDSICCPYAYTF